MLQSFNLGRIDYLAARARQRELVLQRVAGEIGDSLLLCEHPATITCGIRTAAHELPDPPLPEVPLVKVDRGGGATFHGPGQLVLYPVVSLRQSGLGVRDFVWESLRTIAETLGSLGLQSEAELSPAGVWVKKRKICAIGLKIVHGVTDHGVSVNLANDLDVYRYFSPCGLSGEQVTSVAREYENLGKSFSYSAVLDTVSTSFQRYLEKRS